MNRQKMTFDERQERVTKSAGGKVLLLWNERETEDGGWEYDGAWLETGGATDEASLLKAAKKAAEQSIAEWDQSDAVNSFEANGESVWLDKATRVGLMNSTGIAKAAGEPGVKLWLGEKSYYTECDKVTEALSKVEVYAIKCNNATRQHLRDVEAMTDAESVCGYDYTAGYPEKVEIEI